MKHKCKRIRKGKYEYRGHIIQCAGYHAPEHRIVWEAGPKGEIYADFHGFSLKEVKMYIDRDLDKEETSSSGLPSDREGWEKLVKFDVLSEAFMEEYADKLDWKMISKYQKLSEKFIERHADKVNWYEISIHQELSEAFIEKYADKVHWRLISIRQQLSDEFKQRHANRLIR